MEYERTDEERRLDDAMLLVLWSKAQDHAAPDAPADKLKLMKLAFLVAYPLYRDRVRALSLRFYRWKRGPMANQVYSTLADLSASGMLLDEEEIVVLDEGRRLATAFADEVLALPENKAILRTIDDVAESFGPKTTEDVLKHVYSMQCFAVDYPGRHLISAIPQGKGLTDVVDDAEAEAALVVPKSWQTTLELALSGDALRNLQRGVEDSHEGRIFGREAMWTDV